MFSTTIIGNVTKDPALRTVNTANGTVNVCDINIAVNGQKVNGVAPVTYVRATAWRGLADVIAKYVTKGQKICITTNFMSVRAYKNNNGEPAASLECQIDRMELLGGRVGQDSLPVPGPATPPTPVEAEAPVPEAAFALVEDSNLPF